MNEREKKAIAAIAEAVPALDEFSKGFVSGYLAAKEEAGNPKSDEQKKNENSEDDGKEE